MSPEEGDEVASAVLTLVQRLAMTVGAASSDALDPTSAESRWLDSLDPETRAGWPRAAPPELRSP